MNTLTSLIISTVTLTSLAAPRQAAAGFHTWQHADLILGNQDTPTNSSATPSSIAVDPATGKIFIADDYYNRVLRYAGGAALQNGAQPEAVFGQPDMEAVRPATTASGLNGPRGITIDATGRLWVADRSNHRVVGFDNAASASSGVTASIVLGQPDFVSKAVATTAKGMSDPWSVATDALGQLFVSDMGNHRVLRFDNVASKFNGAPANAVIGQVNFVTAAPGLDAQHFNAPSGICLESTGPGAGQVRLWVADYSNNRVLRFDDAALTPGFPTATGVLGQPGFNSKVPGLLADFINGPAGVTTSNGRLYVTEYANNRVLRFDGAGQKPNGAAANGVLGQQDFTSSAADIAHLSQPSGTTTDAAGNLWVADRLHNRSLCFNQPQAKPNGAAADFVLGQPALDGFQFDGAVYGTGLAIDAASGKVFVAEAFRNRVVRYPSYSSLQSGSQPEAVFGQPNFTSTTAGSGALEMRNPNGIFCDSSGRLWVADRGNNRVLRFDAAAAKATGSPASGLLGQGAFGVSLPGNGGNRMDSPAGVSVDDGGRLYVADSGNNRVLRFDNAAARPATAQADGLLGQVIFASTGPGLTAAAMSAPLAVAIDATDHLWVLDSVNHRVLRFDSAHNKAFGAAANGVLGQVNFTTSTGGISSSKLDPAYPAFGQSSALAVDATGRLWVSDGSNTRVLWFNKAAQKAAGAAADGVLGQPDFNTDIYGQSNRHVNVALGLAVDPAGALWVEDYSLGRTLRFTPEAVELSNLQLTGSFLTVHLSNATAGADYMVQSSTDLATWTNSGTFTAPATEFDRLLGVLNGTRRFFRVVEL